MLFNMYDRSPQSGSTLLETLFAVAIFSMVSTALTSLIYLGIQIIRDDQSRLDGLSVAQSQIETIRNATYESIGTVGGVPSGAFEQVETVIRNDRVFTIDTDIRYIDDVFDDVAPADLVNTDYKKVRVEVTWEGQYINDPVLLITTIVPDGLETTAGGGTLWIETHNAETDPVVGATVQITNPTVNPPVSITSYTDINGRFILPGAEPSVQTYHVEVSKDGYSSGQTYVVDPVDNPNPDPGDQSILASEITSLTFFIDQLSSIQFHVEEVGTGNSIVNLPMQLTGSNRIGTDLGGLDIPKYNETITSGADGNVEVVDMEYDTYSIAIDDASGFDFAGSTPHVPYVLPPASNTPLTIQVAVDADQTLLVTVVDGSENPVESASVHVSSVPLPIDLTQSTNASGQTFFTPLDIGVFTIEIIAADFIDYSGTINISDDEMQTISLVAV